MRARDGTYLPFEWTGLTLNDDRVLLASGRPVPVAREHVPVAISELGHLNGLYLDVPGRRLESRDRTFGLTPTEFDLLTLFSHRRGTVLSADHIARAVWGYQAAVSRNFLEAHVSRLRKKLGRAGAGELIETVRGVGYVIR